MKSFVIALALAAVPAFAADRKFGEYSIWCDNMRYNGTRPTDLFIFQPEAEEDLDKVKTAFGTHTSGNRDGQWKLEFDLKVTNLEKAEKLPLLYLELTTTKKTNPNGNPDGAIKSGWVFFDQKWDGNGYFRTFGGSLFRVECTTGKKFEPAE